MTIFMLRYVYKRTVDFSDKKSSTDIKVFLSLVRLSKKVLVDTGNK